MNDLLTALVARAGEYVGRGVNHEQQHFIGSLMIEPLVDGSAVMLHYTATLDDGTQVHSEATLLARLPDASLCLWPVMQELPFVLAHPAIEWSADVSSSLPTVTFASGPRGATSEFREELTISVQPGGVLVYAHAWGLPGGEFSERSTCELRRRDKPLV